MTCKLCDFKEEETIVRIDIGNNESTFVYGKYHDDMALDCLAYINDYRVNSLGIHALTINEDAMIGAKISLKDKRLVKMFLMIGSIR